MPHPTPVDLTNYNILAAAVRHRDSDVIQMVTDAVKQGRVALAFQPVVNARANNSVAFYEGLARVLEPNGRIIPAGDFIEAVEDIELGRLLDCQALDLGLQTLRDVPDLRLSINMSARSIGHPKWTDILMQAVTDDPTVAERLILEITESSAMLVPEHVAVFMKTWSARGISFALDDFGAGFTAFRYFKQFSFDILKIDGQFIRNIAQDPDNQVITKALLSVADQFDMLTVTEHVETAADVEMLKSLGVTYMQGYFLGAPVLNPEWVRNAETAEIGS